MIGNDRPPRRMLVERRNADGRWESYMVPVDRADWRTWAGIAAFLAAALAVWGG